MQIGSLERRLHPEPETPRIPKEDHRSSGTQGLQTRRPHKAWGICVWMHRPYSVQGLCGHAYCTRHVVSVWTCPVDPLGAASAARMDSLLPPHPPVPPLRPHWPPFLTQVSLAGCYAGLPITCSGLRASLQGILPLLLHGPERAALAPNPQGLCSPVTQHRPLSLMPRGPHPPASTPVTWLPRPGVRLLLQEAFPGSLILQAHFLWDCHTELPLRCHRGFALVSSLSSAR